MSRGGSMRHGMKLPTAKKVSKAVEAEITAVAGKAGGCLLRVWEEKMGIRAMVLIADIAYLMKCEPDKYIFTASGFKDKEILR